MHGFQYCVRMCVEVLILTVLYDANWVADQASACYNLLQNGVWSMVVIYITRKHPPSIGGMQRLSYELATELSRLTDLRVISWGHSQAWLPVFLLLAFISVLFLLVTNRSRIEVIHLGDVVLSPLGAITRRFSHVPVSVNAHGLDVTFPNHLYQSLIVPFLRELDLIICNSESTRLECIKRGVHARRCVVVPVGVREIPLAVDKAEARRIISGMAGMNLLEKQVIVTVGRLVKRKGVAYFIDKVLPRIVRVNPDVVYLVVGKGPERGRIQRMARERSLRGHVVLLGEVTDEMLNKIYAAADLFVMPNVTVHGDPEGFGIVALEASAAGLCVIANRVDGIQDAITHGENGLLVEAGDTDGLVSVISEMLADDARRKRFGSQSSRFTLERFGWPSIANRYVNEFHKLHAKGAPV